jgi:prepilin-type N-terminal cleavage/methylation domain-containing protein
VVDNSPPKGFTLLEIIAVLLIFSILAGVVLIRVNSPAELAGRAEVIKNHLRYAQSMAMLSNHVWGVRFEADQYVLFEEDEARLFPGEENPVPLKDLTASPLTIGFDGWGMPLDLAANSPLGADALLRISDSESTLTVTISRDTGFVH